MKAEPRQGERGFERQEERRHMETIVRRRAVALRRWAARYGERRRGVADRLGLREGTLGAWERRRPVAAPRGRPAERADAQSRRQVAVLFRLMGPGVGLPTLQAIFPNVARAELEYLLRRYRDVHLSKSGTLVYSLRWTRPGAVLAMDYTEPPEPVDGVYEDLLAVRDLASRCMPVALPAQRATGEVTAKALEAQFLEHGAPLVVKSDNGSPLDCDEVTTVLDRWGVWQLLSPPGTPQYNGACEAGIGSLKTRAHHEAARHDRPGRWTCDDVEAARRQGNETLRPWGPWRDTPELAWRNRRRITDEERRAFAAEVARLEHKTMVERGYLPGVDPEPFARASIRRVALSRALVACGYLQFRRRRIPLPINPGIWAKIS